MTVGVNPSGIEQGIPSETRWTPWGNTFAPDALKGQRT